MNFAGTAPRSAEALTGFRLSVPSFPDAPAPAELRRRVERRPPEALEAAASAISFYLGFD